MHEMALFQYSKELYSTEDNLFCNKCYYGASAACMYPLISMMYSRHWLPEHGACNLVFIGQVNQTYM